MSLFCWTQRKIFWRMWKTEQFLGTIDFHSIFFPSMEVNGAPKQPGYKRSSKYLPLCSTEQRNSYRFGTNWGWVNDDRMFNFGWTIPSSLLAHVMMSSTTSVFLLRHLLEFCFSFFKTKNNNYNWGNTDVFSLVGWNMNIYLVSFNRSPFFQALNQNPVKKETLTLGSLKMITCFQVLGINIINKHYKKICCFAIWSIFGFPWTSQWTLLWEKCFVLFVK